MTRTKKQLMDRRMMEASRVGRDARPTSTQEALVGLSPPAPVPGPLAVAVACRRFGEAALALAAELEASAATMGKDAARRQAPDEKRPPASDLPLPEERSYSSNAVFTRSSVMKRRAARRSASAVGYDLKHWCKMVRRLEDASGVPRKVFAAMIGVDSATVSNWAIGITFAKAENRKRLEALGRGMQSWEHAAWKNAPVVVGRPS